MVDGGVFWMGGVGVVVGPVEEGLLCWFLLHKEDMRLEYYYKI